MNVYVYDPYVSKDTIEKMGCHSILIEDSLKLADFVSVHLPLNEETKNFINAKSLQEMKDSCVIVNTCLLYTSPSPRDRQKSRMPSSA